MTDREKLEKYPENWYAMFVAILNDWSIAKSLVYMGFKQSSRGDPERLKKYNEGIKIKIEKEWLAEQVKAGYTNKQIGEMACCSAAAVSQLIIKHGIPKNRKCGRPRKKRN